MPKPVRDAYRTELELADQARVAGEPGIEFRHLERAHVIAQAYTFQHVWTHCLMFAFGWRQRDAREIAGQLLRLPAALLMTSIWVPLGNTGGANVSAVKPMPLPDDLKNLLAGPN
ncbi:MAG: DUF3703 domain-containing protein [Ahniella sp.]|nr:DUF3703 domain-containing protein [Ahniella sp.]